MGKNLQHKNVCSPIQNQPGFMWGLFSILKHNHWRYIKKRLPHKRLVGRKHAIGTRNEGNDMKPSTDCVSPSATKTEDNSYVDPVQRIAKPSPHEKLKKPNSREKMKKHNSEEKSKKRHTEDKSKKHHSEEKSRNTNSEIKKSVKALLKAFVLEDKSKRNSRHQRSSTYPVQSNSTEIKPPQHVESSDESCSNEDHTGVFNQSGGISPAIGSLNPLFLMSEESSSSDNDECKLEDIPIDADGNGSDVKERDSRDQKAWYDPKLINSKELMENDDTSSPRRSKACLDALNLIHMNRDFLLKVLQDPGSPLARHFHSQQAFSTKAVLTKAGSFPIPGSPLNNGSQPKDHNIFSTDEKGTSMDFSKSFSIPSIALEYRADGIQKLNETMGKVSDDDSSGFGYTRKRGKNQVVVKRFKDLRQKIKHVIKEHKNEKLRITMDAVLDKVPRKYGFSKDLRYNSFYESVNRSRKEGLKLKQMRRTSSLGGSLHRYLQLYESSFQRESKNEISEKLLPEVDESVLPVRTVKTLGRIHSLPEMKSYSSFKIDEPTENQEQDHSEIPKSFEDHFDAAVEPETTEDMVKNQMELTDASNNEEKIEREIEDEDELILMESRSSADNPCLDYISSYDEKDSEVAISQEHDPRTDIDDDVLIEAQYKTKFNYVRDILEISGYNTTESLSIWHSDYQPLDPLMYEEVITECMIQDQNQDPECEENEDCCHLLLFDLINEVLIEIYERSYHYSPIPLSSLCRIHPMPVGYSVLKDVWIRINGYLRNKVVIDGQPLDVVMSMDLAKTDGWMNLQFDSECVGLELEDLIFDELLEELFVL